MATSPIPAPTGDDPNASNPGPGGGFPSPAPAQTDQNSAELLRMALGVVSTMRVLANKVPAATSEVRQINDLISQLIGKIKSGGPSTESQAPPV